MAPLQSSLFSALLFALALGAHAGDGGFLSQGPSMVTRVESSLSTELAARGDKQIRIQDFMRALRPSFQALPKNKDGHLEHQTVRYILHRLFVQRHGWYIKGLEPNGDVFHMNASSDSFKEWVPSFMVEALEDQLEHSGLDLHDLAVLGAALEDVIQQEASELVQAIHQASRARNHGGNASVQQLVLFYASSFLSHYQWDAEAAVRSYSKLVKEYTDWNRTREWLDRLEQKHLKGANVPPGDKSVAMATNIALDIGAQYSAFNDKVCKELKGAFLGMWSKGKSTGRVRLADFYRMGLDSQWYLTEKPEYLRALGALDESNASSPMVIIANYLTARPNCLDATHLYSVCCPNECEGLFGQLEASIASPSADPSQILDILGRMGSDTTAAPRLFEYSLQDRLRQIAQTHGGKVKLHGRLFAQWMHHAYPTECPYPHEAGVADPSSPDQWLGEDGAASEEERRQIVDAESCSPEEAAAEWKAELPWSHTEEVIAHHVGGSTAIAAKSGMIAQLLLLIGISVVVALVYVQKWALLQDVVLAVQKKVQRQHVCIAAVCLLLVVTRTVNLALLVVLVCVGLLVQLLLTVEMPGTEKVAKVEKCVV